MVPTDFVVEDATPGMVFEAPTGIAFLPGGRMLVAERQGRVWAVTNGVRNPTPMWSGQQEVIDYGDRGLLGIAVDPNYVANRYIYLLYEVDPDSNGVEDDNNCFGRLTRYRVSASDSNLVDPSSRTILMGVDWPHAPLNDFASHAIGSVRFGRDGSMLVSVGDGASFTQLDPGGLDPTAFGAGKTDPFENIGAFRSQYIGSLCGKILRINPANGHGYAGNPYVNGDLTSVQSRVWAYGLRNPYRFTVRPGTGSVDTSAASPGTLLIGEVGWSTYEEMDVVRTKGQNFGWPCYEGFATQASYQSAHPSHHRCSTIGTPSNPATASAPAASWHHDNPASSTPSGSIGNCAIGGVFYTGTRYPVAYRNAYFFGDHGQSWIKVATFNASDQLVQISAFATDMEGPVDFTTNPSGGDVYYTSITAGKVRRIRWNGASSNHSPVVVGTASPGVGSAPLAVSFGSAGTSDPDGNPLTLSWSFGDATGSTLANPTHTYTATGSYSAILTADDGQGGVGHDTLNVIVVGAGGFPTDGVLDSFDRPNGAIGGAWVDNTSGLSIAGNALVSSGSWASTVWSGGTFGPDQEAYITLSAITATAPEHDVMLKIQGMSWTSGHVEVRYDAIQHHVTISTFTPNLGWQTHATLSPLTFQSGDQLGARAYSNGTVEVFRNGVSVGIGSVASWPYAAFGGRVGLTVDGAASSRLDNFGGGTARLNLNTPPSATITSPPNGFFFNATDTVHLAGIASDAQDQESALHDHWVVDLHHNNHVHPAIFTADGATAAFVPGEHDDGTGVFLEVRFQVTDSGGLVDTARVDLEPEIDLRPSAVTTLPTTPGTSAPARYRFEIANSGRMLAPFSRWRLVAGATTLAEGDTLVLARDSVRVERWLAPVLGAGDHVLRVVVDTLAQWPETDETNNATTRTLRVVDGPGPDEIPPAFIDGPTVIPGGSFAEVRWRNDGPATGVVRYGRTPSLGDSVIAGSDSLEVVGLVPLNIGTKYYFCVAATDSAANTGLSPPDSFSTLSTPLDAPARIPVRLALSSAFPNPTSGAAGITLELPRAERVTFAVHDLQGRRVWEEPARDLPAGRWTLTWPGRGARTGLYLARVSAGGRTWLRRVVVLR